MKNDLYEKKSRQYTYIAQKRIKYLGINLSKDTKDLYTENYGTLMKEIKRQKQIYPMLIHWKFTVKMSIISKVTYRFNVIPTKIMVALLTEIEKNSKICTKPQEMPNSQNLF